MTGFYATGEVATGSTAATVTDSTAPTLTAASAAVTGTTTATGSVTTNEVGTLYAIVTTSATATPAQVKAGAIKTVTVPGVQSISFTGLPAGAVLYPHYLQTDNATPPNESAVINGASFTTTTPADTTAPILTAASATPTGATAAAGSVTTNEAGTLYAIVTTSPTATSAQVKAGAVKTVTAPGAQSISFTGLPAGAVLYPHYLQTDNATPPNESAVINGSSFTTPSDQSGSAKATYVQEIFESRAGIPWANLAGMRWYFFDQVWPTPLRAPVAQGSMESTDGAAIDLFDIAGATSLLPGQVGTLAYTNTNGDPDQADLISIFCPVYVH